MTTPVPTPDDPPHADDALRQSAAFFAQALVQDIAMREGAVTPEAVAQITARVVEEIRANCLAKDVTPSPSPHAQDGRA